MHPLPQTLRCWRLMESSHSVGLDCITRVTESRYGRQACQRIAESDSDLDVGLLGAMKPPHQRPTSRQADGKWVLPPSWLLAAPF